MVVEVRAGNHDRCNCPVAVPLPEGVPLDVAALREQSSGVVLPAQPWWRGDRPMLSFMVPFLRAGTTGRFEPFEETGPDMPQVRLSDDGQGGLSVHLGSELFTVYRYGSSVVRPYFYPIYAAPGVGMTRNWPMVGDASYETADHPHHKGMYTAQGEVNGVDNWGESQGRQIHRGFTRIFDGPVDGGFIQRLAWTDGEGGANMTETRIVRFYAGFPGFRLVDYTVTLHASEGRVVLGDTKEAGLLSIRVASSMDAVNPGGGLISNAYGGITEGETWGKPSPWCDYSGPIGNDWYGICMMDHPGNPRYPTPWHVRDYGLMTANCFGYHHFSGDPDNRRDLVLEAGTSLTWDYRVLFHRGNAREAEVGGHYLDFAVPPVVTILTDDYLTVDQLTEDEGGIHG